MVGTENLIQLVIDKLKEQALNGLKPINLCVSHACRRQAMGHYTQTGSRQDGLGTQTIIALSGVKQSNSANKAE